MNLTNSLIANKLKVGDIIQYGIYSKMKHTQIPIFPNDDIPVSSNIKLVKQGTLNRKATPFVKWAGGKRSATPDISKYLPTDISTYYEPFVGGGAVFFTFEHLIKTATLADLNEELVMAYHVIKTDTEKLIDSLLTHAENHNKIEGYYMKVRKQSPEELLDVISRFLYLNKTCFNGLYRVNKSGKFNVPEGKYKNPKICDPDNLRNVAKVLGKATIKVGQFDKTISPKRGDFVYCDPPYDGTYTGYQPDGFDQSDQKRLKTSVDSWSQQGANVMVSNSDTDFIRELYKNYNQQTITAQRSISCNGEQRGKISEILITNYE